MGDEGHIGCACEHPDFFPYHLRHSGCSTWRNLKAWRGDRRFLLVVNFLLGDLQAIVTMALNPDAEWLQDEHSPQFRG